MELEISRIKRNKLLREFTLNEIKEFIKYERSSLYNESLNFSNVFVSMFIHDCMEQSLNELFIRIAISLKIPFNIVKDYISTMNLVTYETNDCKGYVAVPWISDDYEYIYTRYMKLKEMV